MSVCTAAGIALLLPMIGALSTDKPIARANASVQLWVDTSSDNSCEQSSPASGDWLIRNNEGRNVLVTVHHVTTKDGLTTEGETRDTLGPRETRELGCETSEDGHQAMRLVKATF
jgi:hypothetical protein